MSDERYNIFRSTVHWRYAMSRPVLTFFDARLIVFIVLFAFHIRWWTFVLLLLSVVLLSLANYMSYTVENAVRLIRSKIAGPIRTAVPSTRLRPMADYGAEALRDRAHKSAGRKLVE